MSPVWARSLTWALASNGMSREVTSGIGVRGELPPPGRATAPSAAAPSGVPVGGRWRGLASPRGAPEGPHGFFVAANVSPEYALVLAGGSLSREFPVPGPGETALVDEKARAVAEFVARLLGPNMRVRERRAGRATFRWLLEERAGDGWRVVNHFWSPLPWRYVGKRQEVVYQNRQLRDVEVGAPAG